MLFSKLLMGLKPISFGYLSLVVACGADLEGRGALAEISQEDLSEYHRAIDELAQRTGVELLRPTYLPPGTGWEPDTDYGSDQNEAVMMFYPGPSDGPVSERPFIRIAQVTDPDERECPPCTDLDESHLEEWNTNGTRFLTDAGQAGPGRVAALIYFRADDLRVAAYFDWDSPTQTDDMKGEALKVVESMLEDS